MGLSYKERLYTQFIQSNSGSKTIFGTLATQWNAKCQDIGDAVYISEDTYHMYVPENVGANARIVTYYPGDDGYDTDAASLRNYINANHPNDIVLIIKTCYVDYETERPYYLNIANQVAQEKNINVTNYDFYGFSAGAPAASHGTLEAIKENPNLGSQTTVIIDAAYNNQDVVFTGEEINLFKSNGTKFLFFESTRDNGGVSSDNVKELASKGIPVVVAQINDAGHSDVNNFVFNNKVMDYFNGRASSFSNSDQVSYYTYDSNSGGFVPISREKALSIVNSGARYSGDLSVLKNIDYSDITNQYGYLKNLAFIPASVLNNPNLTSDERFIIGHVEKITSLITSSAFLQGIQNNNFSSTSNIPMQEDVCIKEFYLQTGQLLDAISKEVKNVVQISEIIKQTDQSLADKVLDQNVIEETVPIVNAAAGVAGVAGTIISNPSIETPATPIQSETPTQSVKPTQPETSAQPVTPTQPETPAQPVKPTQSETPAQSVTPTQPETPAQSVKPTQPETPAQSVNPTQPGTSAQSVNPTQPGTSTTEPNVTPMPNKESMLSKGAKIIGGIGATAATIAGGIFGMKKHAEKKNRIDDEPEDEESDVDEI